jgi:hypothetical protein
MKAKDIDWSSVDWTRKRIDLARELDIHPSILSRQAKKLGIPMRGAGNVRRGLPNQMNWSEVDWRKSNKQLSAELGINSATISQYRGTHGNPRNHSTSLLSALDVGGGSIKRLLEAMRPGSSLWFPAQFKGTLTSSVHNSGLHGTLKITTWSAYENRGERRSADLIRIEYPES